MNKAPRKSHYRASAGFGIILVAAAVAMNNYVLMGVGLVFFIFGVLKRNQVEES